MLYYDCASACDDSQKSELLDRFVDGTLKAEESHQDLALEEHQVQQLVSEPGEFLHCLILKSAKLGAHAFQSI